MALNMQHLNTRIDHNEGRIDKNEREIDMVKKQVHCAEKDIEVLKNSQATILNRLNFSSKMIVTAAISMFGTLITFLITMLMSR